MAVRNLFDSSFFINITATQSIIYLLFYKYDRLIIINFFYIINLIWTYLIR